MIQHNMLLMNTTLWIQSYDLSYIRDSYLLPSDKMLMLTLPEPRFYNKMVFGVISFNALFQDEMEDMLMMAVTNKRVEFPPIFPSALKKPRHLMILKHLDTHNYWLTSFQLSVFWFQLHKPLRLSKIEDRQKTQKMGRKKIKDKHKKMILQACVLQLKDRRGFKCLKLGLLKMYLLDIKCIWHFLSDVDHLPLSMLFTEKTTTQQLKSLFHYLVGGLTNPKGIVCIWT